VSRYEKGKTNLDYTEERDSEWQCTSWAICKYAARSRQIATPAATTQFCTGRMPFLPPNQQRESTEGSSWMRYYYRNLRFLKCIGASAYRPLLAFKT